MCFVGVVRRTRLSGSLESLREACMRELRVVVLMKGKGVEGERPGLYLHEGVSPGGWNLLETRPGEYSSMIVRGEVKNNK